jgi:hypothetical protein
VGDSVGVAVAGLAVGVDAALFWAEAVVLNAAVGMALRRAAAVVVGRAVGELCVDRAPSVVGGPYFVVVRGVGR